MKPVIKEIEYLHTLDEIAEMLNMSRSTVSHAQRSALEKIRTALQNHGYKADDFLEGCNAKHCIADRSTR